ncbi:MAG: hypothetical protein L3K09_08650, partial [Thermoplasmata archaeon]|nr:hypothetical protein [Thermoplasmata archaeon]
SAFNSLKPSGAPPSTFGPSFVAYYTQVQVALADSVRDVWLVMVPIAIAALLCALLISGKLPTNAEAAADLPAGEAVPTP